MTTASAPGKLMLFGEHAVVYGYPCIVTAIDSRLQVDIEEINSNSIEIDAPQVKDTRFVREAVALTRKQYKIRSKGFRIKTRNAFSCKYGFGSSSAVTVATIYALLSMNNQKIEKKKVFDLAYTCVLNVQKVGSGFDVAAAVYGGNMYYIKGGKQIVPIQSFSNGVDMVIGYTGAKADTVEIVNEIKEKRRNQREKVDRIFHAIGELVDKARVSLEEKDWERVGTYMNFNQDYLRDLGVSSQKLEDMILASKEGGALGAKLSGAGRGDCMIALCYSKDKRKVEKAIERVGGEVIKVETGARGVL